jgi:type II secretory pathway predicted ATPase ExeA
LSQDPFQNESDLRFYFDSASHREPQRRVERGLRQNKGLTVVTGEGGSGKTLLSRRILEALEEEIFETSLMVMLPGATDPQDVLCRFARQMGVEEPASERAALLAQVYERFAIAREEGRHAVLILDDAHLLSRDALAEIGGLLNLEYEDKRLLSLFLIGLPELDVTLSHDACLGQRVDVRVKITSLTLEDTAAYLRHRITFVGGQADVIGDDAVAALFKFGRGRPRLLNTLADNALFEAYLGGRKQMNAGDVERAADDLGIGPDPGTTYGGPALAAGAASLEEGAVDFGLSGGDLGSSDLGAAPDLSASASDSAGAMSFDAGIMAGQGAGVAPGVEVEDAVVEDVAIEDLASEGVAGESAAAAGALDEHAIAEDAGAVSATPGSATADLSELLDETEFAEGEPEPIHVLQSVEGEGDALVEMALEAAEDAVLDLDAAVDGIIEEEPGAVSLGVLEVETESLPVFEAQNSAEPVDAGVTRMAFAEEQPAAASGEDDLDDLFVELIEE